jgi:hypothetical protein
MIWRKHQILTPPSDEELAVMTPEDVLEIHRVYHEAIENAEKDPYQYGFQLPHWKKAEEQLGEVNEILALGGNRSGKTQWGAFSVIRKSSASLKRRRCPSASSKARCGRGYRNT